MTLRIPFTSSQFVAWTLRHGRILWILAIILAIPAAARTAWLYAHLRSDLEELLPRDSPSVVAIEEFRQRAGSHQYLGVVVDAGRSENNRAAERFLDDLASRVRAYPKELVASVRTGNEEEHAFVDRYAPLYMDAGDLRAVRDRIAARKDYDVARETGTALDDDPALALDFHDIQTKYEQRSDANGAPHRRRYTDEERHLSVLLVELSGDSTGASAARSLYDRVHGDIASLGGTEAYALGMRVGYAGDAAITLEELSALVADLSLSSIVVLLAVMAAIVLYYRWWRSLLIVIPPLLLATVYSFGVVSLPPFNVSAVNSNTAFLGSIIVGNGINFGLILLGRYVEERRQGLDVRASLERAVAGSRGGTLAAAAAAGVAYAALALTQFRGFRQFGFIGGFGMLFAWLLAFVLMPSLIARLDTSEATRPKPGPERARFSFWVARGVAKAPGLVAGITLVAAIVAIVQVAGFRASDIESDFSKLRRRDSQVSGEGYWGDRMNAVLGEYLTPFVFLTDSRAQADAVARRLREEVARPPFAGRIASVRTIGDVLPSDQSEKLRLLSDIQEELTPRVRAGLDSQQRDYVERVLGREPLAPLTFDDVPRSFTLGLRERDGSVGRLVLIYPVMNAGWWDANQMRDFVSALRGVARDAVEPTARAPRLAGSVALSSDIVEAIRRDGPIASGAALVGVVGVTLLLLRWRRTAAYVVASLCLGVLLLTGVSRLLGVHVNFANFIAFPITFGIGVDYAVNIVSRYEQDGSLDVLAAVRSTGAAVALCSLTTILGYSSLLMAENRALFLFGLLAVLGEVACLSVALLGLPSFLLLAGRWRRRHELPARGTEVRNVAGAVPPFTSREATRRAS